MYDASNAYAWGDVVKMPVSGNIYICNAINGAPIGYGPEEPFTTLYWDACVDIVDPTGAINRIDPYLEKVKSICTDCGINIDIPEINQETSAAVNDGSSMGGNSFNNRRSRS